MIPKYLSALLALTASALAQSTTSTTSAPPSTKTEWAPNGLGAVLDSGLNGLPHSPYTKDKWTWGTLPKFCFDKAKARGCDVYKVEAYNITYSDCNLGPTVMCRCEDAPVGIDDLATDFGKVPVKGRQWVRYVSAWAPSGDQIDPCAADGSDNNIGIYGFCNNKASVYFHEVGHSLDSWAVGNSGSAWSLGQDWRDRINLDSCVADGYAKSSYPESWAQAVTMAAYHANVQNIWTLQPTVSCMANQMNKAIDQVVNSNPLMKRVQGQTCNRIWPAEATVCMGPEAEAAGACAGISGVQAIEKAEKRTVEKRFFA
ncbi:hypothetical protein BJ508DRAFT_322231 [Ascobolus immersus RN42]|uniref:Conidiation-specific protein 13 n=1 Tax=Ascobolus immersus RN42 TaxID=1160509 RepID=A0A3N4IKA0_ASCIM|nr:hypothetical protein BJ508DRAFT_322231 [Ascobolus immersus RN42]